jgi:hypothetical protein
VRQAKIMASAFITALPLSITLRGRHSGKNLPEKMPRWELAGRTQEMGFKLWHHADNYNPKWRLLPRGILILASVQFACIFLNLHFLRVCVYTAVK